MSDYTKQGAIVPVNMDTTAQLVRELTSARACIKDLAEALEFYSDPNNYEKTFNKKWNIWAENIMYDGGHEATKALAEHKEEIAKCLNE